MAFPTGWNRRAAITIQSSQVSGSGTLTGFAVPLFPESSNGAGDGIPYEALDSDGSYPAQNGGGDIRFSSDSAGTTQLPCEIVDFTTATDPSTATAVVWVKCNPNGSSDVTIYIWYNTAGTESQPAVTDTYGRNNVWTGIGGSDDYLVVSHFNSTSPVDSSGNVTLTVNGSPSAVSDGPNGMSGLDFNGSSDSIDTGITSNSVPRTYIAIVKGDAAPNGLDYSFVFGKSEGGSLSWDHINASFRGTAQVKRGGTWYNASFGTLSGSTIYHLAGVIDTSTIYAYKDGTEAANTSTGSSAIDTDTDSIEAGSFTTYYWAGRIYMILAIDAALSADWLATFYNSINSPTTFVSVGTPQSVGGSTYTLTAAQGSIAISGQAVAFMAARQLVSAQGSVSITGQNASLKADRSLTAAFGSLAITGQDVTLTYSGGGATYTLVAAYGAISISGQATGLIADRTLTASQGALAITGQAASLRRGYTLGAAQGSLAISGQAVALAADRSLSASYGSLAIAGYPALFSYSGSPWTPQSPDTTTWSVQTPDSSTWTEQ